MSSDPTPPGGHARASGTSVRRKEDARLLTGRGRYVSDLELPRMRHVAFVRSPVAHARLTGVDTAAALEVEGVHAVFTGEHPVMAAVALRAQSALPGYVETDQPPLARGKVRFAGEAVAAVLADDRYRAEDGAEAVVVDYDPLRPTVCAWTDPLDITDPVHDEAPDNLLLSRTFRAGDAAEALAGSHVVVERELTTNRHGGNPIECRAGVARYEAADRRLTFWSGTQVPHLVRTQLAELLDLPEGNIRVIAPDVGGGFGVKAVLYPEDVALCLMAIAQPGTALKWVEDRVEHLLSATHARDHRYVLRAGFAEDGALLAVTADVWCNTGAYSVYPWTAGIEPLMAGGLLTGPYKLANYECTVRGVATNTSPSGPYRGVARPSTVFAMEALMDSGARALGTDPIALRRRNLILPADIPYRMPSRLVDDSGAYEACLDRALDVFDVGRWRAEQSRRRDDGERPVGIGVGLYNELTGLGRAASAGPRMPFRTGHDACTVRVNPDGDVTVFSGVTSQGQGLETTMAQVVADALGVTYEAVDVRIGDTDESLWGFGAFSSRQAVIGGGAAHLAGAHVREKVLALAGALKEVDVADLDLRGGQIHVRGQEKPVISLAEVARVAYLQSDRLPEGFEPGLEGTRFYDPIRGAFAAGAQIAAIEFDPVTGEIRILSWVCVEDAGTIVHPVIVDGQIAGSIAQGIGGAMYEHLVYDDAGNLTTGTLLDYLMPTSGEIPELTIDHVSTPAPNPTGVRGVGEGGTLGPNAVVAGALADALGVEVDDLPVTPARVWDLVNGGGAR
jgi:carbon-monoxide dehydrogenase large subunit